MICKHIIEIMKVTIGQNIVNKINKFFSHKQVSPQDYCVLCGSMYPQDYGIFMKEITRNCHCMWASTVPNILAYGG